VKNKNLGTKLGKKICVFVKVWDLLNVFRKSLNCGRKHILCKLKTSDKPHTIRIMYLKSILPGIPPNTTLLWHSGSEFWTFWY